MVAIREIHNDRVLLHAVRCADAIPTLHERDLSLLTSSPDHRVRRWHVDALTDAARSDQDLHLGARVERVPDLVPHVLVPVRRDELDRSELAALRRLR